MQIKIHDIGAFTFTAENDADIAINKSLEGKLLLVLEKGNLIKATVKEVIKNAFENMEKKEKEEYAKEFKELFDGI